MRGPLVAEISQLGTPPCDTCRYAGLCKHLPFACYAFSVFVETGEAIAEYREPTHDWYTQIFHSTSGRGRGRPRHHDNKNNKVVENAASKQ